MIRSPGRHARPLSVAAVAAGALARAAMVAPLIRGEVDDPDNYLELARAVAEGRGLMLAGRPTAYRPPLYPLLLAPGAALLGAEVGWWVALLNLAAGGATVALVGAAARHWGMGPGRRLLAMTIVALDPVLVAQARGAMTETTAALLVAALLAAVGPSVTSRSAIGVGVLGGLAGLCRPSLLPATALIAAIQVWRGPGRRAARLARGAAVLAAMVATLAPWAARNWRVFGEPVWTTTHGGYTLLLANNPTYYDEVVDGPLPVWGGPNQGRWFRRMNELAIGLPEPASDRLYRGMALAAARERPATFARASVGRLSRFWAVAPDPTVYSGGLRLATMAWTSPFWLLVAAGLARRSSRSWPGVSALCVVATLTAIHAFYWTDLRMRAPAVPALALIAAMGARSRLGAADRRG